ncbi:MAG: DinB family protein [Caldilineaceae bacterium]|nr:DinB family protein [Caldilineaceae bacterium]
MLISRPDPSEYLPYQIEYVKRVQSEDVLTMLATQIGESMTLLRGLTDEQVLYRPAPDEWNIKEIIGHMADTERIFAYRALCFARGDQSPLPGFEQDDYVRESGADEIQISDLLSEFEHLRRANQIAIHNLSDEAVMQTGTASGMTVSVRALVYMLVGHVEHHMASLKEKYLPFIP